MMLLLAREQAARAEMTTPRTHLGGMPYMNMVGIEVA